MSKTATIKKINPFRLLRSGAERKNVPTALSKSTGDVLRQVVYRVPSANLVPRVLFYTGRREPRCDFLETFAFCRHQPRSSLCAPASTKHSKKRFYLISPPPSPPRQKLMTGHDYEWLQDAVILLSCTTRFLFVFPFIL